jgi:hypothetical protein
MKGMIKLIMNNLITRSTIADLRDIRNRLQKIYQKIILDTFYSQKTKKMEGKDLDDWWRLHESLYVNAYKS